MNYGSLCFLRNRFFLTYRIYACIVVCSISFSFNFYRICTDMPCFITDISNLYLLFFFSYYRFVNVELLKKSPYFIDFSLLFSVINFIDSCSLLLFFSFCLLLVYFALFFLSVCLFYVLKVGV